MKFLFLSLYFLILSIFLISFISCLFTSQSEVDKIKSLNKEIYNKMTTIKISNSEIYTCIIQFIAYGIFGYVIKKYFLDGNIIFFFKRFRSENLHENEKEKYISMFIPFILSISLLFLIYDDSTLVYMIIVLIIVSLLIPFRYLMGFFCFLCLFYITGCISLLYLENEMGISVHCNDCGINNYTSLKMLKAIYENDVRSNILKTWSKNTPEHDRNKEIYNIVTDFETRLGCPNNPFIYHEIGHIIYNHHFKYALLSSILVACTIFPLILYLYFTIRRRTDSERMKKLIYIISFFSSTILIAFLIQYILNIFKLKQELCADDFALKIGDLYYIRTYVLYLEKNGEIDSIRINSLLKLLNGYCLNHWSTVRRLIVKLN